MHGATVVCSFSIYSRVGIFEKWCKVSMHGAASSMHGATPSMHGAAVVCSSSTCSHGGIFGEWSEI